MHDQISSATDLLPLGQRLLRAGFPRITNADLHRELGCDEIATLENSMIRDRLQSDAVEKSPGRRVHIEECDTYYRAVVTAWGPFEFTGRSQYAQKVTCNVSQVPLDDYVAGTVPDAALKRIAVARHLGVTEFAVCFPIIGKVERADPIVVGLLGKQMIRVAEWK